MNRYRTTVKRFSMAVILALIFILSETALAAGLDPAALADGTYTIKMSGQDVILENADGDFCILNAATDIVVPNNSLTLDVTADATIHTIKVTAGGLTINGSNKLTVTGTDAYAVWAEGKIVIDGKLVSTGNVIISNTPDQDIIINGELTGTSVAATGSIAVEESGVLETTYSNVAAGKDITVNGKLESACGVFAAGELTVSGELSNTGAAVGVGGDLIVSGTLISSDCDKENGIAVDGDLIINGGAIVAIDNTFSVDVGGDISITDGSLTVTNCEKDSGVFIRNGNLMINGGILTSNGNAYNGVYVPMGNITVNGGSLTAKDNGYPSVYAGTGGITVTNGGTVEGAGTLNGVYTEGDIAVSGANSTIKGIAQTRGKNNADTAAVYTTGGTISAASGAVIWEDYTNTPVVFDDITPQDPYEDGANITDIANYTWTPHLVLSSGGTGLLATANRGAVTVMGSRTGSVTGEKVSLDASSKHKITFAGTLAATTMTKADITLAAPVRGAVSTEARVTQGETGYAHTSTAWTVTGGNPLATGDSFAASTEYTATIVLKAESGEKFDTAIGKADITLPGGGTVDVVDVTVDGQTLTVTINFPRTAPMPAPTPALTVTAPQGSLPMRGSLRLTASEAGVKWTTSDETIATVDEDGNVTAVGSGEVTITATTQDGRTATVRLTVTKPDDPDPVEAFDIGIEVLAVQKGKELILPVLKGYTGSWSVDKESVAKITKNGKRVKAVALGEATLTFTVDKVVSKKAAIVLDGRKLKEGESYPIKFCVRKAGELPTKVTLDAKKLTLNLNENKAVKLTAAVKPNKALDKEVFWTSNKPSVATVDQDGNVTAFAPGTCKITAVSANLKRVAITVTVKGAVTKVTLNKGKLTLKVGETFELIATVKPEDALDKTVTWTSGKPGVATVENGVVTALKKGSVKITATASNGKKAVCTVTVK